MKVLYIVNKDFSKFKGNVINTMPFVEKEAKNGKDILNSTYVHYTDGKTFEQYNREHGGELVALTWDEFNTQFYSPYLNSMCEPFTETTEEQFFYGLECLPPKRWKTEGNKEVFFMGECYTADLYRAFVRIGDKYYTALRRISTPFEHLFNLQTLKSLQNV